MSTPRYSKSDKGKWVSDVSRSRRKGPLQIPTSENTKLIEANRLTLIGRVTNPHIQKTRALVDFFLQHWHVVGSITGRDLGPDLFQFKFETEHDLLSVLNKAPFHFKRWMLILQRWEPIVSDQFPAYIPFWIKIHGIPLHHWTEATIDAIGSELGRVEDKDVEKGRVRVLINGLRPLEMNMEIELSSEEVKQVEFEYEKLEKHCFLCYSLSHEKDDCPSKRATRDLTSTRTSISQSRTLERIEDDRRRHDERRLARRNPPEQSRWPTYRPTPRAPRQQNREWERAPHSHGESTREFNPHRHPSEDYGRDRPVRSVSARTLPSAHTPSGTHRSQDSRLRSDSPRSVWRRVQRPTFHSTPSHSVHSQVSHTPSPIPPREDMLQQKVINSGEGSGKGDRRSALERLSGQADRVPLLVNGAANSDSGRLQEVAIQYLEDTMPIHLIGSNSKVGIGSTSGARPLTQNSPIRSLSEDRLHVSLRLGPCPTSESPPPELQMEQTAPEQPALKSKAAGKRKSAATTTRKRVARSPIQGVSLKKRRIAKVQNSPKRKLSSGLTVGGTAASQLPDDNQPSTTIIPGITRRGSGFRTAPSSLP